MPVAVCPNIDQYFPPKLNLLLSWSSLFRSVGTFSNYLAYVRTAGLVADVSTEVCSPVKLCVLVWSSTTVQVFNHPALRKAKDSVRRAGNFQSRLRLFVTRSMVESILEHCNGCPRLKRYGVLFLVTYCFLLRLPSEALNIKLNEEGLSLQGEELILKLTRRKNKIGGSRLVRTCWCRESKVPAHAHSPRQGFLVFQHA